MSDRLQIKRSLTDANTSNVEFGELAFTANGDILYIGDESNNAIAIAGKRTPGTLTPNQAIVVDSNSEINSFTANTITVKTYLKEPGDAPLNRKVDLLWKKIGFNKATTDLISNKLATDETITSNLIISPSEIWNQAGSIPSTKPSSNAGVVVVYNELESVEDSTSESYRTWSTNQINWISDRFGSTYKIQVYVDSAGSGNPSSNGTQLLQNGSGNDDEWYFDYQSGTLHFIGVNIPSSLVDGKTVYITGAKYSGDTGFSGVSLSSANLVNATITSLSTPLEVKDGGTGVSSFTANSLLAAANTSTMAFKTGSNGQVMFVTDNDVEFGDLDGGTY
jgi:hypothetical protein